MTIGHTDTTLDLLEDTAASFATRDAARVRAMRDSGTHLDRAMWHRLAEIGWLSILVPEEMDGAGLDLGAAVIVTRRLGRGAFPEPFVAAGILAQRVLVAAQDDARDERLARTMAGELIIGVGWHGDVSVTAGDVLSGQSRHVGVCGADAYVVAASGDAGLGLYLVAADARGLTVRADRLADGSFSAHLQLDDVRGLVVVSPPAGEDVRSEERRVGKECRSRW